MSEGITVAVALLNVFVAYLAMMTRSEVRQAKLDLLKEIRDLYPDRKELNPQLKDIQRRLSTIEANCRQERSGGSQAGRAELTIHHQIENADQDEEPSAIWQPQTQE